MMIGFLLSFFSFVCNVVMTCDFFHSLVSYPLLVTFRGLYLQTFLFLSFFVCFIPSSSVLSKRQQYPFLNLEFGLGRKDLRLTITYVRSR